MDTDLAGPVLPLSLLTNSEFEHCLVTLSVWQVQIGAVALQKEEENKSLFQT